MPPRVPMPSAPGDAPERAGQADEAEVDRPEQVDGAARRGAPLPPVVPVELRGSAPGQRLAAAPSARLVDRVRDPVPAQGTAQPAARVRVQEGPAVLAEPPGRPQALEAAMTRARTALALGPAPTLLPEDVHVVVEVDAEGVVLGATQRTLWRATRSGPARVAVAEQVPFDVPGRPALEGVQGCTPGRTYADLREGLFVTVLDLPGPVRPDSTRVTRHRVRLAGGRDVRREVLRRFEAPVERVRLEVRFHPARLPSRGTASVTTAQGGVDVEVPLAGRRLVWSGRTVDACAVGLRWSW